MNKSGALPSLSLRLQLGLAFFAFILIGINDGAVGVLIPSLQAHYHIDKATVGLLFLCGTAGYLVAAFNSGLLVEKLGTRCFLLLATCLFLLGVAVLSLVPPFVVFAAMLFLLGCGAGLLDAGLNAYIAGLPRSTGLLNYLHAFYGIGALCGPLIASMILVLGLSWNSVYSVWFVLAALLLLGFAIVFKNQPTVRHENEIKAKGNVLLAILKLRIVWLAAGFLLLYVGVEVSLGNWSYSYLTEERHIATLFAGWTVSGYWLGLTLGRLVLGGLIQRVGEQRAISGCVIGVMFGVIVTWLAPFNALVACGLCLTGFCLGPLFPTTIALLSKAVPTRLLAAAIGFLASLGSMGGALFPWIAGALAQIFGLWSLLPYAIVLTLLMLLVWLLLNARLTSQGARQYSPE